MARHALQVSEAELKGEHSENDIADRVPRAEVKRQLGRCTVDDAVRVDILAEQENLEGPEGELIDRAVLEEHHLPLRQAQVRVSHACPEEERVKVRPVLREADEVEL